MEQSESAFVVRTYQSCDKQACRELFVSGLVDGNKLAPDDVGADIDTIETCYLSAPANHFWVAQLEAPVTTVVAMIGVKGRGDGTAEIRRLRVHEQYRRRGIGSALMEQALRFCQEQNYLRIILDTYMERDPAIQLFHKFQFQHGRTRKCGEKDMLYFYLDLYGRPLPRE